MKVLLCSTHEGGRQLLLCEQLRDAKIAFEVGAPDGELGHGLSWRPKLEWFRDALGRCDPSEWVILSDAWDVVFQAPHDPDGPRVALERALTFHCPSTGALVSGEKNCWPDTDRQVHYAMGPTPWMFVNSGGIAGRARELSAMLTWGLENFHDYICEDDQRFWTSMHLHQAGAGRTPRLGKVQIDYHCQVFQTMFLNASDELQIQPAGAMVNTRTTSIPFFLHWNGGSNWPTQPLQLMGMV